MKLYDAPIAPNPRRVRWEKAEKAIAEIVAFVGIDFARIVRLRPPEELTSLGRWADAMRERPAAKA